MRRKVRRQRAREPSQATEEERYDEDVDRERRGKERRTEVKPEKRSRCSLVPAKARQSVRVALEVGILVVIGVLAATDVGADRSREREDEQKEGLSDIDDNGHANLLEDTLKTAEEGHMVGENEGGDCGKMR